MYAGAGDVFGALGKEHFRGIFHRDHARIAHFKQTQLIDGTKTVLDRAQNAVFVLTIALKIQHDVHHVLQHSRAGDRAFLGDVADEEHCAACRLRHAHEHAGAFAHLRHAARRAGHIGAVHRLDGVDDHVVRLDLLPAALGFVHRIFAEDEQIVALDAKASGAHLDLARRFFAGNIEHACAGCGKVFARLQEQGRFADTRVAAHEHQRAFHHAAAKHAVEFADACGFSGGALFADLLKAQRFGAGARALLDGLCRRRAGFGRLFFQCIPSIAAGTLAHPSGRFVSAGAAAVNGLLFRHGFSLRG